MAQNTIRIVNVAKRNRYDSGRLLQFCVQGNRCSIWTWSRESAEVIKAKVAIDQMTVTTADYF